MPPFEIQFPPELVPALASRFPEVDESGPETMGAAARARRSATFGPWRRWA